MKRPYKLFRIAALGMLIWLIAGLACLCFSCKAEAGQIGESRIRLSLDLVDYESATNILTGYAPEIWRGMPTRFEIGIYNSGAFVTNLSSFVSVSVEVFADSSRSGPAFLKVTQTNLSAALTESNWLAGAEASAHAVFELTASQTSFDLSEAIENVQQYWMVWYATTATTDNYTLGSSVIRVHQSGAPATAVIGSSNMYVRITLDGKLQVYNETTAGWHDLYLRGAAGSESLVIGEAAGSGSGVATASVVSVNCDTNGNITSIGLETLRQMNGLAAETNVANIKARYEADHDILVDYTNTTDGRLQALETTTNIDEKVSTAGDIMHGTLENQSALKVSSVAGTGAELYDNVTMTSYVSWVNSGPSIYTDGVYRIGLSSNISGIHSHMYQYSVLTPGWWTFTWAVSNYGLLTNVSINVSKYGVPLAARLWDSGGVMWTNASGTTNLYFPYAGGAGLWLAVTNSEEGATTNYVFDVELFSCRAVETTDVWAVNADGSAYGFKMSWLPVTNAWTNSDFVLKTTDGTNFYWVAP